MTIAGNPEFAAGFKAAVKYWTERPTLIQMPPVKRKWLDKQSADFRDGWAVGAATVP